MFDLLIKNGTLVDGTGAPPRRADLAVRHGEIKEIALLPDATAARVIDAAGKLVTPGFIDIHRHADINLFTEGFGEPELRQGLTTIVNGNCGLSVVPCPPPYREDILRFLQPVIGEYGNAPYFETFPQYMEAAAQARLPLNVGMLAGNGTVRAAVKGYESGPLTRAECAAAHHHLHAAIKAGALGISLGLVYAPENCYHMDGLVEALQPVAGRGIPLMTHIRGEGDLFHESLLEVIELARRLDVPLHISHLKCIGKRNWGHGVARALEILDEARAAGLEVDCDLYPYTAGSTQLIQILPPEFLEGGAKEIAARLRDPGQRRLLTEILREPSAHFENLVSSIGWENIRCSTLTTPQNQRFTGKTIAEIAEIQGKDPFDCCYDLLVEEECRISMVDFITSEEDIRTILRYPYSSVISDSVYPTGGVPHPRLFAAFPKVLIDYVRETPVLPLETAIHKMTGKPAAVCRLNRKGILRRGMDADINIFSLDAVTAKADYDNPKQLASGFDFVIVNGVPAVEGDRLTSAPCGKLLRRG